MTDFETGDIVEIVNPPEGVEAWSDHDYGGLSLGDRVVFIDRDYALVGQTGTVVKLVFGYVYTDNPAIGGGWHHERLALVGEPDDDMQPGDYLAEAVHLFLMGHTALSQLTAAADAYDDVILSGGVAG